jgi:uncharacterized protein (DUF885 family)
MRRFHFLIMVASSLLLSCSIVKEDNARFEGLANNFIEGFLPLNPEWATSLGDHRYDHLLSDYSPAGIENKKSFYLAYLDSLEEISVEKLNPVSRIDFEILENSIRSMIFNLDTLRSFEWNPRVYNPGRAVYSLMVREFAPLGERMRNAVSRLEGVPELLRQGRENLKNPPEIYTETAIRQIKGTVSLISDDLPLYLEQLPEPIEGFDEIQGQAIDALEEYGRWLEEELLPVSHGDFRVGEKNYRTKLRYTLNSDLPMEEILKSAEAELRKTHVEIYETALPLFEKYYPGRLAEAADTSEVVRSVLDSLANEHPNAENIVEAARISLKACEDFVREKAIVSLPGEPIKVIVMPEFQRGFAVAYCDSPGPLEKGAKTFYAISPPPSDWDAQRVESYFREYNDFMLLDLTIHEAMPGHYLQLAHSNRFQAPTMVRSIFDSGTFTEGWATYAEQLMVENGFGGEELKMQMLKMRLRMLINVIIDQKIHTAGMTEQQAMAMMMNEGYQEEGEAAGKWRRACLSSTQLSTYYVGNLELNEIRRAYEQQLGDQFDQKEFHDKLLSFGSPPPRFVRQLLGL